MHMFMGHVVVLYYYMLAFCDSVVLVIMFVRIISPVLANITVHYFSLLLS